MGQTLRKRVKQTQFISPMQEAWVNLFVASDYLREKFDEICSEFDITRGQYNVLRILRGIYPNGHPRCEVSKRMIERAPDVTRLIDSLERQGLAERVDSEDDARLSVARITKKGLKLLDQMQPKIDGYDAQLKTKLNRLESLKLSELCEKIYSE